jgi:hypothetical protein
VPAAANLVEIDLTTREDEKRLERTRELVEIVRRTSRRDPTPAP